MQKEFRKLTYKEKMKINGGASTGVPQFIVNVVGDLFGWLWS